MRVTGSSRSTGQAAASTEASTNSDKKKIAIHQALFHYL
jgi:hypothetical protein